MHLQPPIRALYYQYIFSTFSRQKNRSLFDQLRHPSEHPGSPYQGVILSIHFFYLFPTKKSVAFQPAPTPSEHPGSPPIRALYYQYIFFTFSRQKNRSLFDRICLSIFYSNGTRVSIPRAVFLFNFLELHSDTLFSLYYCFRLCL